LASQSIDQGALAAARWSSDADNVGLAGVAVERSQERLGLSAVVFDQADGTGYRPATSGQDTFEELVDHKTFSRIKVTI
jgi:hypothetical protein